jgi:hypothetical protein
MSDMHCFRRHMIGGWLVHATAVLAGHPQQAMRMRLAAVLGTGLRLG